MRALNIAGILIFIAFAIKLVNYADLFPGTSLDVYTGPDIFGTIQSYTPTTEDMTSYALLNLMAFVGFLVQSLVFFIFMLGYITILLPFFLGQLGLPAVITLPITAGCWLVYLIDYNEYRARMKPLSG